MYTINTELDTYNYILFYSQRFNYVVFRRIRDAMTLLTLCVCMVSIHRNAIGFQAFIIIVIIIFVIIIIIIIIITCITS